jgi:hypothetical protein
VIFNGGRQKERKRNMKTYEELRKINVNEHIEKKNNLSYLSWAWAVDILFQNDPEASWTYRECDGKPYMTIGEPPTFLVFCTVKAFGRERTAQLPIMDYKNKALAVFTAFDLNTTMQRCLAKAISLHGIGLYIYAGEDLPEGANPEPPTDKKETPGKIVDQALAMEGMAPEVSKAIRDEAKKIEEAFYKVGLSAAVGGYNAFEKVCNEGELEALWQLLDSKVRSAIRKVLAARTEMV